MLDKVFGVMVLTLNNYFRNRYFIAEDLVVASNLLNLDGTAAAQIDNKIVLSLVGINYDAQPQSEDLVPNLKIMVSANFNSNNYAEALKTLSLAIKFFQRHAVLNHQNTLELDAELIELNVSMENLSVTEMHQIWSTLASRYLPSVLFRVQVKLAPESQLQYSLAPQLE